MREGRRHGRHSVFFRLALTLVIAGAAVNFIVISFQRAVWGPGAHRQVYRMIEQYADYVIRELGAPPDARRAAGVLDKGGYELRFEGPRGSFASRPDLPGIAELRQRGRGPDQRFGWVRDGFFVLVHKPQGTYAFFLRWHSVPWRIEAFVALLLALCGVLMLVGWRLRRMLIPLRELEAGIQMLGKGVLDVNVAPRGRGELAALAESFNWMASEIKRRVASQRQLLSDVSHELRSPLTRMRLALEFIEDSKSRASISADIDELDVMIGELLESERLESPSGALKLESVDLAALAREAAALKTGIRLELQQQPLIHSVDQGRIRRLLGNLLDNAVKYSLPESEPVLLRLELEAGRPVFTVQDYGAGISAEALPHIFEPFYRADPSRSRESGGYGLGLSLCKKIAEAHGGTISVESELGSGTTLRVKL